MALVGDGSGGECVPEPATSLVVSVKDYGATGNGVTDDTAAIQAAINYVAGRGGGTVNVPAGTYRIDVVSSTVNLRSRVTLKLDASAILQAIPNSSSNYHVVTFNAVTDACLVGGVVQGDRNEHTGSTGEYGNGVVIYNSRNVVVSNVVARDCWGDGFYVGNGSVNILFCGVTADGNRRQGMSITDATDVVVRNSTFRYSSGVSPEAGLDIEPNSGESVSNVTITGCLFEWNAGDGLACGPALSSSSASVTGVLIEGNVLRYNGRSPVDGSVRAAIEVSNCLGTRVSDNEVTQNGGRGILFREGGSQSICTGNVVTGTLLPQGDGIMEYLCAGNTITGNTSRGNAGYGLRTVECTGSTISGNTLSDNGK